MSRWMLVVLLGAVACASVVATAATGAKSAFPGLNGRIVFATGTNDLWSVLDDGSALELLTTVVAPPGVSSFASYPSFSADGSKIAVMLNELDRPTPCDPGGINGGSGPCRALILMNADGSNQQVVYQSEDIASLQLSLSPDGRADSRSTWMEDTFALSPGNAPTSLRRTQARRGRRTERRLPSSRIAMRR